MKQILFMVPNCGSCAYVKDWLESTDTLQYVETEWVYNRDGKVTKRAAAFDVYDGPILIVLKDGEEIQRLVGARKITPAIVKSNADC